MGDKVDLCECGKNPKAEPHVCPFKDDVHNDDFTLCTCCPDCEQECKDDI